MIVQTLTTTSQKSMLWTLNKEGNKAMSKTAVYTIKNNIQGKMYIGITTDPVKRFSAHRIEAFRNKKISKLYCAMRKYGLENFEFKIIRWCDNREDAIELEIFLIAENKTREYGYNVCPGGEGAGSGKDSHRYGKKITKEHAEKLQQAASFYRKGKKYSDEEKANLKEKLKAIPGHLEACTKRLLDARLLVNEEKRKALASEALKKPEVRAKISAGLKGKPKSPEHAAKAAAAARPSRLGKKQSEETKAKRSESMKIAWAKRKSGEL